MTYEEFKTGVMDVTPVTDGLEFKIAVLWLHPSTLPVGVVAVHSAECAVRIPQWHKNYADRVVPVIAVGNDVLGTNPNMTDLILPPSIDRLTRHTLNSCRNLKRMTFPKKITRIPEGAFKDCAALEDIYYEGSKDDWEKINVVWKKDEYTVDNSKLGLYCPVTATRYPVPGNEAVFRARIHFDCDLGKDESCFGVFLKGKPLPLKRTV